MFTFILNMADKHVFSVQKLLTKKRIFTHEEIENYIFDKNEELSEVSEEEYSLSDVSDEENSEPEILELSLEEEMPAFVDALSSSDNSLENVFPGSYIPIWKSEPSNNRVHPFEFTGISGCNQDIVKNDPLYLFELYFTDEICEFIVNETNRYASQTINKKELSVKSRMRRWKPVTVSEVRQYIAIFLYQGVLWKPTYEMYYTTNPLFASAGIKWLLSYNKFKLIDKFIHFVDSSTLPNKYPVLSKISTVWDYLTKKFQEVYTPTQNISIDESLLLWKGRLSWKQCIRSKSARFGIKTFSLCESDSGYVWKSILYTGSELTNTLSSDYRYIATKIVMSLMDGLLDQGYKLYIDSWYSSYELSSVLLLRSTDTIGTLQKNRKGLPISIHEKLKKNERKVLYEEKTNIMITHWKDKKDVYTISTCTIDGAKNVLRAGKEKLVPLVIDDYNQNMGGVDRSDQMMTSYEVERKRVKKWYKKVFTHLINLAAFNAQIICKKMGRNMTPLNFRTMLITSMIQRYGQQPKKSHSRLVANNPLRLIDRHFPSYVPASEKKINAQRRCVVCHKQKIRKDSRYECVECDVGLCAAPCFMTFHTKTEY